MRRENGFTIVEALVALVILSIALLTLYSVGETLVDKSAHIAINDRAIFFAQSKLELLALEEAPLPKYEKGTESGFQWEVAADNIQSDRIWDKQVLQNVRLSVSWQSKYRQRSLSIETRHLGRTPS
jgi:prepilin-type N-terminal cleavage/methylation domain-containing protein